MEEFFNIIHYCYYRMDCKVESYMASVTFRLFGMIPLISNRWDEEKLDDPKKAYMMFYKNKKYGLGTIFAGKAMYGLNAIIGISFYWLILGFISYFRHCTFEEISYIPILIICMLPFALATYYCCFRNDIYLEYFKYFEKKDKKWHKNGILFP